MAKKANPARPRPRLFVMNDPYPLRISAQLALEIGFNESVVLLQLEYLISISNTEPRDGLLWTYQSLDDLNSYFPWWGRETVNRAVHSLRQQGLIRIGNFNQRKSDHTRWFVLDPAGVSRLNSVRLDTGVIVIENARRAPKKPTQPGMSESHFETGQPDSESQNETPESHFETGESQNETTLPETPTETPTETPNKDFPATAEVNLTSRAPKPAARSSAADSDFSENPKPESWDDQPETQKPAPDSNRWTLRDLAQANTINSKKVAAMVERDVYPEALAQWLAEAYARPGLTNPVGFAVQNALDYPAGRGHSLFARRRKPEILKKLAYAIAGYPMSEDAEFAGFVRKYSKPNLLNLFLALGGDEQDIPAQYVRPKPESKPAATAADEPVEVSAEVLAYAESLRSRIGGKP